MKIARFENSGIYFGCESEPDTDKCDSFRILRVVLKGARDTHASDDTRRCVLMARLRGKSKEFENLWNTALVSGPFKIMANVRR